LGPLPPLANSPCAPGSQVSSSVFPPFAIAFLDERIRLGHALRLQVRRVPLDDSARPQGEYAQEHDLGQAGAVLEVAPPRPSALAGVEPVAVVAGGPGQRLRRGGGAAPRSPPQTWPPPRP